MRLGILRGSWLARLTSLFISFLLLLFLNRVGQAAPLAQVVTGTSNLFVHVSAPPGVQVDDNAAIRANHVKVNELALFAEAGTGLREWVVLNLFDDVVLTAVRQRVESNPSGSVTWIGSVEGMAHSSVFLVYNQGVMVGNVATGTAVYEIRYTSGEHHRVVEIDLAQLENSGDDSVIPPPSLLNPTPLNPETPSDDGSVVDVLVVYTPNAETIVGGHAAMQALIELGISETNQAYEQSGVNQRAFLAHYEQVAYTESTQSTDLGRLATPGDGFMDNVHTLRDTYHADFVALIVDGTDLSGCGIGYLQDPAPNPGFGGAAFTVTRYDCVSPNYTFAHELGHNMGLRHDWYVDGNSTPYTHAHGYVNFANQWRSIMAYNNRCADFASFCTRLLYFANPDNNYEGNPMGVTPGTSAACVAGSTTPDPSTCDADARLVLNSTAANNASFRSSSTTWTGDTDTDWNTASNWSNGIVPRFLDDVFIPTTPTGGVFPIGSGTLNARNVTIETGASVQMSGGTLNVYGHWDEQGTGTFTATGGAVIFLGLIPQTITANSGSAFNDVQIGDGTGMTEVTLLTDVDINGDLNIMNNGSLYGGSNTIRVAGNWTDYGTSFEPETSTVILDGVTQTITKTVTLTILDEPFDEADGGGCGCNSVKLPIGWVREQSGGTNGFLGGDLGLGGEAIRWNDSADAWLHTTAMTLKPGVTYEVEYTYRNASGGVTNSFSVYLGSGQSSTSMTTLVSTASTTSTAYNTQTDTFTVATEGIYYLGLRSQQVVGAGYAAFGSIHLQGTRNITFYDLQVSSTGSATFMQDVAVNSNLTVNSGGVMDLSTNDVTVEGAVVNNGRIRQTKDTPASTTTEFLHITDSAVSADKYYGVYVTPAGNMGATTVQVAGNQTGCTGVLGDQLITRCFDVSPSTPQSATVRFWFTEAERNGQDASALVVWHWDSGGGVWNQASSTSTYNRSEGGAACTSGGGLACFVEAVAVTDYSPFVPGSGLAPTAVSLQQLRAEQSRQTILWLVALMLLLLSGLTIYKQRVRA
ncbi:MAG: hypothetical protein H6658_20275 [Ardenticatenaceae bacterium]|nr:hypothetical protein [Ardenticatenaceae bacterium]